MRLTDFTKATRDEMLADFLNERSCRDREGDL